MSLFARSFLLIALLLLGSLAASFQISRMYEREPRARALAQQTASVVNLTRAALVNADPAMRRALLVELNEREGIRIYPASPAEKLQPLPERAFLALVAERVRAALGPQTRFAFARDGQRGFWVSFFIDSDEFWVMQPRERVEPPFGLRWLGWGAVVLALALAGAWLVASGIARPLAALTLAAGRLGRGAAHEPVPEQGPRELRTMAAAFNRMARDLESMERERAMVLAGISHDLRTPLSRLRLALEMSGAERGAAEGMGADIEEIDKVIGQFLDYARGEGEAKTPGDVEQLLDDLEEHYAKLGRRIVRTRGNPPAVPMARASLRRALANLVDNALAYAGEPVEIETRRDGDGTIIEVRDRGPGIPAGEAERLKQPFTRLDDARSGRGGAGLGLAIVERVARAHRGALELVPREGGGLVARLRIPA
jgi:two-component system osmolarity sensor histidine kinase EnvZ